MPKFGEADGENRTVHKALPAVLFGIAILLVIQLALLLVHTALLLSGRELIPTRMGFLASKWIPAIGFLLLGSVGTRLLLGSRKPNRSQKALLIDMVLWGLALLLLGVWSFVGPKPMQ